MDARSSADLTGDLLHRLADIDNIIGLKECTRYASKLREVAYALADRYALVPNAARWMMPFDYRLGAVGYITIYGNCDPAYALRMHDVCLSGDFERAQEMWSMARGLAGFIYSQGFDRTTSFAKEMARIAGQPMGTFERLPLIRPGVEERRKLRELDDRGRHEGS